MSAGHSADVSAAHTSGPWRVRPLIREIGFETERVVLGPSDQWVATIPEHSVSGTSVRDANAYLAAAAPDLLEVCILLAGFAEDASTLDFNEDRNRTWAAIVAANARSIIAKATGEAA